MSMFDRSSRSGTHVSDAPPPGAYTPSLLSKPVRPSMAPFSTGERRATHKPSKLGNRVPTPQQYLGHEPIKLPGNAQAHKSFLTTSQRFDSREKSHSIRIKDGKILVRRAENSQTPGPGQYELRDDPAHRTASFSFSTAARPTTAPASSTMDDLGKALTWANLRKNPPSIPSAIDYGYDVAPDGALVPQIPPKDKLPRAVTPGPTSYQPNSFTTANHSSKSAYLAFGSSHSKRVDFSKLGETHNPGPGAYDTTLDPAQFHPSAQLPSFSFASKARKGIEAVIGRTATGAKLGPGAHFDDKSTTAFRPRTASSVPTHHFGTTQLRFAPDAHAVTPGPGAYRSHSDADEVASAARRHEAVLARLSTSRALREEVRHTMKTRSLSPEKNGDTENTHAALHTRDVPHVPVFFTSSTRFHVGLLGQAELPPVGAYNIASDIAARAQSAPSGTRNNTFNVSGERFTGNAALALKSTPTVVGPGAYCVDEVPTQRRRAQQNRPSSSFLTRVERVMPTANKDIGTESLAAINLRTQMGSTGISVSAQFGQHAALAPGRSASKTSKVPGPGAYDVSKPIINTAALKRHAPGKSFSTTSDQVSSVSMYMGAADRFQLDREAAKTPGPGEYAADLNIVSQTRRTFNVSLAANEARSIIKKQNMTATAQG